jgi:hypothetical protein
MEEIDITLPFFYSPISYLLLVLILLTPMFRAIIRAIEALPG